MKKLILMILMSLYSLTTMAKLIEPKLIDEETYKLGADIVNSIQKQIPDFKPFSLKHFTQDIREMLPFPMLAIGDYNGDKIQDAAILGYSNKQKKVFLIAAISKANKYEIIMISQNKISKDAFQNTEYIDSTQPVAYKKYKRDVLQHGSYEDFIGIQEVLMFSDKKKAFVRVD